VPGCRQACLSASWHFLPKGMLLEAMKESIKKYARDGSSLADLRPTGRVASCRWLVGIELQRPHTL
jgi:hypothetical protein